MATDDDDDQDEPLDGMPVEVLPASAEEYARLVRYAANARADEEDHARRRRREEGEEAMRQHVLIFEDDPALGRLMQDVLEEEAGYPVTRVEEFDTAFTVARSTLHPLVFLVDAAWLRWADDIVARFTECADEMPPMAWVVCGNLWDPPAELEAFLARREAERFEMPFNSDDLLAVVARAAERLPSGGITGAAKVYGSREE
jgi:hypothetical protein